MMKTFADNGRVTLLFISLIALLNAFPQPAAAQGFGAIKKDTHLYRRHPPEIVIPQANLAVRQASGGAPGAYEYEGIVRGALENLISTNGGALARRTVDRGDLMGSGGPRYVLNKENPEAIVYYSITSLVNSSNWKKKTEYEKVKVGEKEEWDEKKQKAKKKDVYETRAVEHRYQALTASAVVKLTVQDARTRERIGSCQVSSYYEKEFKDGEGAPGERELFTRLFNELENDLAACLFQTGEKVEILLPKGKFEDASEMIEKGQFDAARRSLDALPPMKKPEDEAYRTYSFGAISEILAYKTADLQAAQQYLQEAASQYAKAGEVKPDERFFKDAKLRAEWSLKLYAKLEAQTNRSEIAGKDREKPADRLTTRSAPTGNELAEKPPPTSTASVSRELQPSSISASKKPVTKPLVPADDKQAVTPAPPASVLTNEVIVKMVKAGLSEENIIATIHEAPATNFDLSPNAQVQLIQSGVTNRIISAMRQAKKSQ